MQKHWMMIMIYPVPTASTWYSPRQTKILPVADKPNSRSSLPLPCLWLHKPLPHADGDLPPSPASPDLSFWKKDVRSWWRSLKLIAQYSRLYQHQAADVCSFWHATQSSWDSKQKWQEMVFTSSYCCFQPLVNTKWRPRTTWAYYRKLNPVYITYCIYE